ncbi:hypothetical protein ACSQ67_008706 [Phaseolus vulgaris]
MELQVEVERLKGELAKKNEEMIQKGEKLVQERKLSPTMPLIHTWRALKKSSHKPRQSTLKWISPNLVWAR